MPRGESSGRFLGALAGAHAHINGVEVLQVPSGGPVWRLKPDGTATEWMGQRLIESHPDDAKQIWHILDSNNKLIAPRGCEAIAATDRAWAYRLGERIGADVIQKCYTSWGTVFVGSSPIASG